MLHYLQSKGKFLYIFLFIIGLCLGMYFLVARNATNTVKRAILQRQQILVRAESGNITSFFQVFGDSIAFLSQLPTIWKLDANTAKDLDIFVEQWRDSGVVSGIALTDSKGIVLFNSNIEGTHDTGISLSDRDYFIWAKQKPKDSEYFVGKPVVSRLGASKGGMIVPVASAIYNNGVLKGVLVASVRLDSLTKNYIDLMQVSDLTEVYLLDQSGKVIYKNNATNTLPDGHEFSSHLEKILKHKEEGKLESDEHLLAYSNIGLNDQNWLLIMATPTYEVSTHTAPINLRLIILAVMISVAVLFHGVINVKKETEILK
ncbi:MAG: cache domain-containing protein [Microgenomates group bacterium]